MCIVGSLSEGRWVQRQVDSFALAGLSSADDEESMGNSVKVDQKGRLKIPATLLTTFNQHGTEFYITSENGDSVRIYPMRVWNQVEKRLKRLCSHNRNNEKLLALAKYFGSAVTVDKQGRVLIPIGLRRSAQMRGAVDILDYLPYLE